MLVIIDNGHGVETPGKRSPIWSDGRQLFEFRFNRQIASMIHEDLYHLGIKSRLLVPEENDVSLIERVSRANLIAKHNPGAWLLSIHSNAGRGTGWEAWTSPGETTSDQIATLLSYEADRFLKPEGFPVRKDMSDGDPDKESKFYILIHTTCPAVLTENLFMDTEKDCRFLMSMTGRKIITELHIEAIRKLAGS